MPTNRRISAEMQKIQGTDGTQNSKEHMPTIGENGDTDNNGSETTGEENGKANENGDGKVPDENGEEPGLTKTGRL